MNITFANSPRWVNQAQTAITLTVQFETLPEPVSFLASPDDVEAHGVTLYNNAVAGLYGSIAAYVAPPTPVPSEITALQFLLQAATDGIITQLEALEAAQTGSVPALIQAVFDSLAPTQSFAAQVRWARMTSIPRTDPLVAAVGQALSMTTQQMDTFFINAAAL
jgi:hypothetical protein